MNLNFQISPLVLLEHFAVFGEIENHVVNYDQDMCDGCILFKATTSANELADLQDFRIGTAKFAIAKADADTHESNVHSKQSTILLDLDDFSLLNILGYLDFIDTLSVFDTCRRLRLLAEDKFRTIHSTINFSDLFTVCDWNEHRFGLNDMRRLCVGVGHHLRKLDIAGLIFPLNETTLAAQLIMTHCKRLKSLTLTGFSLPAQFPSNCFEQLETLKLHLCDIPYSPSAIFPRCSELTTLVVRQFTLDNGRWLVTRFPSLQNVVICISEGDFAISNVLQFLSLNRYIRELKFYYGKVLAMNTILRHISNLRQLESLDFSVHCTNEEFNKHIMCLSRLTQLKALTLNCRGHLAKDLVAVLSNIGTIELLHLCEFNDNDTLLNMIGRCPRITSLMLKGMPNITGDALGRLAINLPILDTIYIGMCNQLTASHVLQCIKNAPQLKSITLDKCCFTITDIFIYELQDICRRRNHLLKCDVSKNGREFSEDVLLDRLINLEVVDCLKGINNNV